MLRLLGGGRNVLCDNSISEVGLNMRILLSAAFIVSSALAAHAGDLQVQVPEIDALAGLSALAVIGSVAVLVWERRRK